MFDLAVQPDDKVVVVGRSGGAGGRFYAARYTTSGVLDATFSSDGHLAWNYSPGIDLATGVGVDGNGDIVSAGRMAEDARDFVQRHLAV